MTSMQRILFFVLTLLIISCNQDVTPRPIELCSYDNKKWSKTQQGSFLINSRLSDNLKFDTILLPYNQVGDYAIFQGDIMLGNINEFELLQKDYQVESFVTTNAIWKKGNIPYSFGDLIDENAKNVIRSAMVEWETKTQLIRFVPKTDADVNFLEFNASDGYSSNIGMKGLKQLIFVKSVPDKGNVMHELGHSLGLWHEHCRPDRDMYIHIVEQNIDTNYTSQFLQQIKDVSTLSSSYDLNSIMHYPLNAFGKNGRQTIKIVLNTYGSKVNVGNRDSLSIGDIAAIKTIYKNL
ncbi:M12 family metallopeptidase [Ferruginibacter paludis]|uniref:M12 family metallopeptidase n=1 Tax=Ferruginibacter paludis TaxID=1310417 RepID=UPI0025B4F754|nr:M12 family metallopeptidase [Ferruginibacter paludis]MDN3658666.1 M12 family metallopeptidase [Ferruginibacter paludis]